MDLVILNGLRALARIGCTSQERNYTQRLEFDLQVQVDLERASHSLSLDDTICYKTVSEMVIKLCLSQEWVLLEQLGTAMIAKIFERWKNAQSVRLTLKKFVIAEAESVGIVLERKRK